MKIPLLICFLSIAQPALRAETRPLLFTYTKNLGLVGQIRILDDFVSYKDGTTTQGIIVKVPSLSYSFGTLNFLPEEINFIRVIPGKPGYLQMITQTGEVYVGKAIDNFFVFRDPLTGNESHVSLASIDFVLLKPKEGSQQANSTISHAILTNGDVFPVKINEQRIEVSNGVSSNYIESSEILSLSFNGGIQGTVNSNGKEQLLPLCFAKSPCLNVSTGSGKYDLRLPWTQISQITKNFLYEREFGEQVEATLEEPVLSHTQEVEPQLSTTFEKDFGEEIEFVNDFIAVADFNLDDLEEEEEKTSESEIEFAIADFDLDDLEEEEEKKSESEIEFAIADFDLDDLEDEEEKKSESENEYRFAAGTDFNLDDLEEEEEKDKKEAIEFISQLEENKTEEVAMLAAPAFRSLPQEEVSEFIYIPALQEKDPGFYISTQLVTNLEYEEFIQEVNYRTPRHWVGGKIPKGTENHPVINVSYKDAYLYTVWCGKRLPSRNEIEYADQNQYIKLHRRYQEWTATPVLNETAKTYAGHLIYGQEGTLPKNNCDCDHLTGFRVASDAY